MVLWKRVGERWDQWGFVSQTHLYGFSICLVIWPWPRSFCIHWHTDLVWFSRNTCLEALLCLLWNRCVLAHKRQSELLCVYCFPCYFESSVPPFFFRICYHHSVCARLGVAQSYLTLRDPVYCNRPVSSVHGILQSRILGWVVISSSRGSSWPGDRTHISCIADRFFTPEPLGKPPSSQCKCGLLNLSLWLCQTKLFDSNSLKAFLPSSKSVAPWR